MNLQLQFLLAAVVQSVTGNYWSRNEELCVPSPPPSQGSLWSLTTFTPLVVDLSFPPSVKVEETFFLDVSIYNVFSSSIPVSFEVERNPAYEVVTEPCSMCVSAGDQPSVTFSIKAVSGGDTNLSVSAWIEPDYPSQCGFEVAVSKSYHIVSPINIAFPGYLAERTWTVYVCSYDLKGNPFISLKGLLPPRSTVPGSSRAWLTVSGDLLGSPLRNIDHLIGLPSGCGEQRMAQHAPNVFVLQYLSASGQATPQRIALLTDYIRRGYEFQRRNFRQSDGSYTFFSGRNGSTWLTAFVLKIFSMSSAFVPVDQNDITSTKDWLKSQQLDNGCFTRVGHSHNRRMQPLERGGMPGAMAAYVAIALLEARESPSSPVITKALQCIAEATAPGTEGAEDSYLLALRAYAYSLAGATEASDAIAELFQRSSENDDGLYWRMWLDYNEGNYENTALSIETTSYALLSILTLNSRHISHEDARRMVRWLVTTMNSHGGFLSTQDTVMALQALSSFAIHEAEEPPSLTLRIFNAGPQEKRVSITEENKLEAQIVEVDNLPAFPSVLIEGEGCFVIQGALRYNIKEDEPSEVFTLEVSSEANYNAESCPAYKIEVCVAYHLVNQPSNMGMIEVTLLSGYSPVLEDLNLIGSIERYEVQGSTVSLYFDEFTSAKTCIEFTVFRESQVQDTQPGNVMAYDYYEPDFFVSKPLEFGPMLCGSG